MLSALTPSQLSNQIPGQQPFFITGSYPGATWTTFNSFNNGYGVYEPYSQSLIASDVEGAGSYIAANQNVTNQMSAELLQTFPAMAQGEGVFTPSYSGVAPVGYIPPSSVAPPSTRPTVVTVTTTGGSSPTPVVTSYTVPPSASPGGTVQNGTISNSSLSIPGATPSMTSNDGVNAVSTNVVSGGMSLSTMLLIGGAAVVGLMILGKK